MTKLELFVISGTTVILGILISIFLYFAIMALIHTMGWWAVIPILLGLLPDPHQ